MAIRPEGLAATAIRRIASSQRGITLIAFVQRTASNASRKSISETSPRTSSTFSQPRDRTRRVAPASIVGEQSSPTARPEAPTALSRWRTCPPRPQATSRTRSPSRSPRRKTARSRRIGSSPENPRTETAPDAPRRPTTSYLARTRSTSEDSRSTGTDLDRRAERDRGVWRFRPGGGDASQGRRRASEEDKGKGRDPEDLEHKGDDGGQGRLGPEEREREDDREPEVLEGGERRRGDLIGPRRPDGSGDREQDDPQPERADEREGGERREDLRVREQDGPRGARDREDEEEEGEAHGRRTDLVDPGDAAERAGQDEREADQEQGLQEEIPGRDGPPREDEGQPGHEGEAQEI